MPRFPLAVAVMLSLTGVTAVNAQGPSLSRALRDIPPARHDVTTGEGLTATVGIATLFLIDRPVRDFLQAHRSNTLNGVAGVFRTMGTAPVYGGAALGIIGAGLIADDEEVKRAGGRLLLSEVITIVTDKALKKLIGRARPDAKESPWDIDPLANRQVSFPSGHAALAFTLATSLADDLHNTWSSIALYTFATGTAWSRLTDNRHWPSDVIGGAVLGFTVSRMMSNRWEILGIRPPAFLTEPASASP